MATDTSVSRATLWLRRHRLGAIEPSELLVARLDARRQGMRLNVILVATALVTMATWRVIDRRTNPAARDTTEAADVAWFAGTSVAFILVLCVGLWQQHRVERRLLSTVRTRSAHPVAYGVARVLGARHLAAAAVTYAGGLLLGATAAALSTRSTDRSLALAFLLAVAVLTVLGCLVLAGVLRRPSVAEDAESLLVDDVLRTHDAHAAVAPYPILVAVVAVIGRDVDAVLLWSFLGYVAIGSTAWVRAEAAR